MSNSDLTRRSFLGFSGAATVGSAIPAASRIPQSEAATTNQITGCDSHSNIILFVADEMRADALACYGNPVTKTPNFDRIAAEGVKFANCHVQFPICGPSRCSMVTGWPASVRGHRSQSYFLRRDEPNLFRYLKNAGYDVFWLGKNDMLAAESFYDSVTHWKEGGIYGQGPGGGDATGVTPGIHSFLFAPTHEDRRHTHDYALVQSAFEILERKESERPFCIFLALNQPHPPYQAISDFYSMYSPSGIPPLIPPGLSRRPALHEASRKAYGLDKLTDATFRKIRAVYYGQVSFVDWLLGELLEAIERTNHAKDTAVLCFSDHGDYAGDFGLVEKEQALEDPLTHIPMLLRIPGGTRGVNAQEMVELYDMMQTCLDLAGIEAEHTHFARSLLPQAHGKAGNPDRAAFAETGVNIYEPQCFQAPAQGDSLYGPKMKLLIEHPELFSRCAMVRTRDAKLIVRPHGQSELYSYKSDPQERENIYGDRSAAGLQERLKEKLLHWYINTTGIAPFDRDQRNCPRINEGRSAPDPRWQQALLDE